MGVTAVSRAVGGGKREEEGKKREEEYVFIPQHQQEKVTSIINNSRLGNVAQTSHDWLAVQPYFHTNPIRISSPQLS